MYLDLLMGINFLVDLLLLLAADRLSGFPQSRKRIALGALLGGIYGGVCMIPGARFLGNTFWRMVALAGMGMLAYGISRSAVRRTMVFVLLSMALGGIANAVGMGNFPALLLSCGILWGICALGITGTLGQTQYIPVELSYGEKHASLLALRDTGNTLRDPVTGQQVLVVGADIAQALLGLKKEQLSQPVETVAAAGIPGLRLIPYHSVGQSGKMLLAMRMADSKIGTQRGNMLVAFAPDILCRDGTYQALTGGAV